MNIDKLINEKTLNCPKEIKKILDTNHHVTPTPFESKNDILKSKKLQEEIGFERLEDGTYIVSMTCLMPRVTKEMIDWWFWWHPQDDKRYRVWFPEEHFEISYARKNKEYFNKDNMPEFEPNTQYPKERVGKYKMTLNIDFVSPEDFGYSRREMEKNNVAQIICGHVGIFKGKLMHTEMSHIFFKRENGLYLVSRFWLGHLLKNKVLRRIFFNEDAAKQMAIHCCREYRNLAKILHDLYTQYNK